MNNRTVKRRSNSHGLLGAAAKEQPTGFGTATVEAKREFVEVIIEYGYLFDAR